MATNSFFRLDDPHADNVRGHHIDPSWWSRSYEYPWAIDYANGVAADMGCGWWPRPLKDALAETCKHVYCVDHDERVYELDDGRYENVAYIHADFSEYVRQIPNKHLDRVFCISVLEETKDVEGALWEFRRVLKDDGLMVLTFDVPHISDHPSTPYPGLLMDNFLRDIKMVGLKFVGEQDFDKEGLVHHPGYNLCVFHCVLEKTHDDD